MGWNDDELDDEGLLGVAPCNPTNETMGTVATEDVLMSTKEMNVLQQKVEILVVAKPRRRR